MARLGARQPLGSSLGRMRRKQSAQFRGGLHFICATSFSCSKFRAIAVLEAFNPGIRRGNDRSCYLSCPRACASKIKTILELEADRRRNHPDDSRGISVCRPGSSIVGNGGIGDRSPSASGFSSQNFEDSLSPLKRFLFRADLRSFPFCLSGESASALRVFGS